MKTKVIEVIAPEYYGNAKVWALQQVIRLDEQEGYNVLCVEPVANEKNELVKILVTVEDK